MWWGAGRGPAALPAELGCRWQVWHRHRQWFASGSEAPAKLPTILPVSLQEDLEGVKAQQLEVEAQAQVRALQPCCACCACCACYHTLRPHGWLAWPGSTLGHPSVRALWSTGRRSRSANPHRAGAGCGAVCQPARAATRPAGKPRCRAGMGGQGGTKGACFSPSCTSVEAGRCWLLWGVAPWPPEPPAWPSIPIGRTGSTRPAARWMQPPWRRGAASCSRRALAVEWGTRAGRAGMTQCWLVAGASCNLVLGSCRDGPCCRFKPRLAGLPLPSIPAAQAQEAVAEVAAREKELEAEAEAAARQVGGVQLACGCSEARRVETDQPAYLHSPLFSSLCLSGQGAGRGARQAAQRGSGGRPDHPGGGGGGGSGAAGTCCVVVNL